MTQATAATSLRDRILDEAHRLTTEEGWSSVTMQGLAEAVGVSRQTVYNEVGGKAPLAEALILDELRRFLAVVDGAFEAHPDDLVAAIRTAVEAVLERASDHALLRAVVSATHGADTELLPLLTTHSSSLLAVAKGVLLDRVKRYPLDLTEQELAGGIDMIVRVVLSHVMQPSDTPTATAARITSVASRILVHY